LRNGGGMALAGDRGGGRYPIGDEAPRLILAFERGSGCPMRSPGPGKGGGGDLGTVRPATMRRVSAQRRGFGASAGWTAGEDQPGVGRRRWLSGGSGGCRHHRSSFVGRALFRGRSGRWPCGLGGASGQEPGLGVAGSAGHRCTAVGGTASGARLLGGFCQEVTGAHGQGAHTAGPTPSWWGG